jgi:tRNA A22 N-methylase
MSQLEQIETAILSLPSHEFEKLRQWFLNLDYELWDEQIERDIADGKLEALAAEALAKFTESINEFEQGEGMPLNQAFAEFKEKYGIPD